jgi:hypothetical protein
VPIPWGSQRSFQNGPSYWTSQAIVRRGPITPPGCGYPLERFPLILKMSLELSPFHDFFLDRGTKESQPEMASGGQEVLLAKEMEPVSKVISHRQEDADDNCGRWLMDRCSDDHGLRHGHRRCGGSGRRDRHRGRYGVRGRQGGAHRHWRRRGGRRDLRHHEVEQVMEASIKTWIPVSAGLVY